MTEIPVRHFRGRDGVQLAYRELGEGRPLIMIHGYLSNAVIMAGTGLAGRLAARGYRVILPDLRGHGDSARPHDPAAYPPDALADDGLALIEQLALTDYDLGGYSLGGRTMATTTPPRRWPVHWPTRATSCCPEITAPPSPRRSSRARSPASFANDQIRSRPRGQAMLCSS
jgi:pimeloyl-ACP methyl ester carboxylesterase